MKLTEKLIERMQNPIQISDLPMWRKVFVFFAIGFLVFTLARGVDQHFTIYGSAPDHPVSSTGQVYEVDVMHGNIRYVTLQTKRNFDLWAGKAVTWAGAAFVAAFFILITSPRGRNRRLIGPLIDRRK